MTIAEDAVAQAKAALTSFILDPANHDILALVKTLRNGIVFGTFIRAPHALVMTFLFRSGSLRSKIMAIITATRQHAMTLAIFAIFYKLTMATLQSSRSLIASGTLHKHTPQTGKALRGTKQVDSVISGFVGAYLFFGCTKEGRSAVAQQVVAYVFARVFLASAKLAIAPARAPVGSGTPVKVRGLLEEWLGDEGAAIARKRAAQHAWPLYCSVTFGVGMWIFQWYPDAMQPSFRSSLDYIYNGSERWTGLRDFFWVNK